MIVPLAIRRKRRVRALWLGALLACVAGPVLAQPLVQTVMELTLSLYQARSALLQAHQLQLLVNLIEQL